MSTCFKRLIVFGIIKLISKFYFIMFSLKIISLALKLLRNLYMYITESYLMLRMSNYKSLNHFTNQKDNHFLGQLTLE